MIDLDSGQLTIVKSILKEQVPDYEVRAFGSRVRGNPKPYSDLDLAVLAAQPLGLTQMGRLREAFEESDLLIRVDVLDWHTISDSFRQVIEEGYEVLQEAPAS